MISPIVKPQNFHMANYIYIYILMGMTRLHPTDEENTTDEESTHDEVVLNNEETSHH